MLPYVSLAINRIQLINLYVCSSNLHMLGGGNKNEFIRKFVTSC